MNYLQKCLAAFQQVTEKKFGKPQDLAAIERSVEHLRNQKILTYEDLRAFESPAHWTFGKYWVFPPEDHVTGELKGRVFNLGPLAGGEERALVSSLFEVLRSIELVSIILRFVLPEHYGIISPPVESFLEVRRGSSDVETYLNYVKDLRDIMRHYDLRRVADADMALWVLHERSFGFSSREAEAIEREVARDRFIRRVRAKNLLDRFLGESSYAELANSLLETNQQLAAQIGGIAFEQMVRRRHPHGAWKEKDLGELIYELHAQRHLDPVVRRQWRDARLIRNKAIHGEAVTRFEVETLLKALDAGRSA